MDVIYGKGCKQSLFPGSLGVCCEPEMEELQHILYQGGSAAQRQRQETSPLRTLMVF